MFDPAYVAPETIRPLRREEYDRLVEQGLFDDERLELLRGALVTMSPQGSPHAAVIRLLTHLLVPVLHGRALVQIQCPLAVSDDSEPEPDVAVLEPADDGYASGHPHTAHLVIEVADSSLATDRAIKSELYASAGVPEYWIVNLAEQVVEVHRVPGAAGYQQVTRRDRSATLHVHAFPDVALHVADFLPEIG
ncbi:MAG: Uma2 family endonuclease [Proteobacteria bacterium]|nr:Uma2 family endonuclease [Pseudomonadota bacterium]